MNDANPRQQIVDSIKNNNNVLVTVSTNPSVDELSAALGLTILLNNLGKRGTAVVSGQLPPAIDFLEPGKTFEHTTDSLRDFIIALDKEKADHLRYKVDGDVVKIFITPYRTQLGEKDLQFSLGDYNVEVVIALGVKDQDHLDKALDAHGAILHDATVATLTSGDNASTLGSINWQDQTASSLCEMLVSLTEALKEDKPLLDQQTSTAFLTGIVSATDRFSNDHTTSRVMTMAAQLMAAGANQQLIAAKLQEAHEIGPTKATAQPSNPDGTTSLAEGAGPTKVKKAQTDAKKQQNAKDGLLIAIDHAEQDKPKSSSKPKGEPKKEPEAPVSAPESTEMPSPEETPEQALARELAEVVPPTQEPSMALGEELAKTSDEPAPEPSSLDFEALLPTASPPPPPQLSPDISTHSDGGYMDGQPPATPALNGATQPDAEAPTVDPFATPLVAPSLPPLQPDPLLAEPHNEPQMAHTITPVHAPNEIEYEESPIPNDPAAVASVPDFAAMNPTGLANPAPVAPPAEPAADDLQSPAPPSLDNLPPLPPLPPLPDLSTPPPPPGGGGTLPASGLLAPPPTPGQFKIPGQ